MNTDEHFVEEQDETPIMGELDKSDDVDTPSSDASNVEHTDEQLAGDSSGEEEVKENGQSKGEKFFYNVISFVLFIIGLVIVSYIRACIRG